MRHELIALVLACATGAAQADCTLVFGQGRNATLRGGPDWDQLNKAFSTAVANALEAEGRRVHPSTLSSREITPEASGLALLEQADRLGCRTLVETTVFADAQETLVLRLRVYPLLPQLGDGGIVGLRIGAPLFVTQRDLPSAAVLRIRPELLGAQMAAEYLQRDRR
jgi:hypothetical protein